MFIRYFSLVTLVLLCLMGGYLSLLPEFSTSPWTPNRTLRNMGFSYEAVLAYEHHLPTVLHFVAGLLLMLLLLGSGLFSGHGGQIALCLSIVAAVLAAAELLQLTVGRNAQISDLLTGLGGALLAAGLVTLWRTRSVRVQT